MQPAQFEREADALISAATRARYQEQSGRPQTQSLPMVYERYPDAWSLDTYEQLLDVEADPKIALGLQRLVAEQFVQSAVARHDARIAATDYAITVEWAGQTLPLRLAQQMASLEPERGPRHELDAAIREASAPLRRLHLDRLLATRAQMVQIEQYGHPSDDLGFWASVQGVAVDEVSKLATWLLEETSELYLDALRDQLIHHKLDEGDTWEVDLEWLFRGEAYDRIFPDHRLMPTVTRAVWDLGIRLQDQSNIRMDLDDLPAKVARSFCAPIGVPDEVVAVLAPRGGIADFAAMLELLGQAERYAHADRTASVVYRRLGDAALTEGYGLLLSGLLLRPDWLAIRLEADATRDAIRLRAFERLYRLRHAAAAHLYEVELRKAEEPDALESEYVDRFADALMVRPFAEEFLDVTGDPFASARHLRAALLGSQLGQFLEREHDQEWYRSARAGRFLIDRWREGQRYTAEELARFLGFEGLDPSFLMAELRAALVG
ncbi:MAG: hypothetical protein AB7P40_06910 [Chloroflexota bacterium]